MTSSCRSDGGPYSCPSRSSGRHVCTGEGEHLLHTCAWCRGWWLDEEDAVAAS
jgi:hypothetical protein